MSNVFQIKSGDLLPAMVVDLVDGGGNPVDVSSGGITVTVRMVDEEGTVVLERAAVKDDTIVNRVRLVWEAGDTDEPGSYEVDWAATFTGKQQSFPTGTYNTVQIVPSYAQLSDYPVDEVVRIRKLSGELEQTTLSFLDIVAYMEPWTTSAGDVDEFAVARDIWLYKAAKLADLVDVSESGSNRKLGDLYKQALAMAETIGKQSPLIRNSELAAVASARRSRTRAIVRP